MFINDVTRKEEIRNIAVQHLRNYGIKYRAKKARVQTQVSRCGKKCFKVPLHELEPETVTLPNGQQLVVPKRVHEMCSFILSKAQTEGVFRKEGSKARQNQIKMSLDRGNPLGSDCHVIDVAAVLKSFLRELPEPLIPVTHNDLFLMCNLDKRPRQDAINCTLLACLLLPSQNLNVLSYLMQFFREVASHSADNKMNFSNLSILIGPNIFPMDDKLAPKSSLTVTRICDITRLLIENSKRIGVIPDNIIEQIGSENVDTLEKRRKNKRRSGSLTRMLNGLKKMVSSKSEDDIVSGKTPDLLLTPVICNVKKRKGEGGLSLKKKKEVLTKLPDCALLNAPFTPSRTPVSVNPNGGKKNSEDSNNSLNTTKDKKMHWYMRSRSMKSLKEDSIASNTRPSFGPKAILERRWSAVSSAANFRKKKRASCAPAVKNQPLDEPDYVRVSKKEYEDFKNRVSAIERRISLELDQVQTEDEDKPNMIENVQTEFEKTMETASLSPTTDHLAKRLSRDLRIRRSDEQKIIRSPSARKIGSLRRKSSEREKKSSQIVRNRSWHLGATLSDQEVAPLLPRIGSKRRSRRNKPEPADSNSQVTITSNESGHWTSARGFFDCPDTHPEDTSANARASIAKLRSQNVGMVRAKAKLFDTLKESDTSDSSRSNSAQKSAKKESAETSKTSHRVKALRVDGRETKKSPRQKYSHLAQRQRLQSIGKQYVQNHKELANSLRDSPNLSRGTPTSSPRRAVPHIKGQLTVKTPKRLCRTPAMDKRTPFKAFATPM